MFALWLKFHHSYPNFMTRGSGLALQFPGNCMGLFFRDVTWPLILIYTEAVYFIILSLAARYCSVWTEETSTCWLEKVWSLISLRLSHPSPHLSSLSLSCRWQSPSKAPFGRGLGVCSWLLMQLLLWAELGAHLAGRNLCQVQCGLPPRAAIKGSLFPPLPLCQDVALTPERWKLPITPPHSATF